MEKGGGGVAMGSFVEEGSRRKHAKDLKTRIKRRMRRLIYSSSICISTLEFLSCLDINLYHLLLCCCFLLCSKTTSNNYMSIIKNKPTLGMIQSFYISKAALKSH